MMHTLLAESVENFECNYSFDAIFATFNIYVFL